MARSTNSQLPAWNLKDILNPRDLDKIETEIKQRVAKLAAPAVKKRFTSRMSPVAFAKRMGELEMIDRALSKLGTYASALFSIDTKDQQAAALVARVKSLAVETEQALMSYGLEWKRFDERNARRLLKAVPNYRYHLSRLRAYRSYTLGDEAEKVITIKEKNGTNALVTLYDIMTSSYRYTVKLAPKSGTRDGTREKSKTREVQITDILQLVRSPKANERKAAYDALLAKYAENKEVLGELYKAVVDDWGEEAKLRHYPSPIAVRNKANDLPDKAIEVLLRVCKRNAKIFHEYFKKKAKMLGRKLTRYDLYAPLGKKQTMEYDTALVEILASFKQFHPRFYDAANRIITEKHIDARVLPNKRPGAYCTYPSTDVAPYVFLSFTNDLQSAETLAHELGHAVHGVLAEHQSEYEYNAALPVCETASTFAELLLADRLKQKRPALARQLALRMLDDYYATIMRQAWFVLFEIEAHELVKKHATIDEISARYLKQLKEQFGTALPVPDNFRYEWLYIPHIYHTPFYCYAYSFGSLLSLALYAQYKREPRYAEKIIALLAKGGSTSPAKMVRAAGFDLADEQFWQSGFGVIRKMIKEL